MNSINKLMFETLKVSNPAKYVFHVQLNRPKKLNAMNLTLWKEMVTCFNELHENQDCRSVVLSGNGPSLTAGIDLNSFAGPLTEMSELEPGRRGFALKKIIESFQSSFTSIEKCSKPVIAAISGACIGAGVDMISACDIRYCSQDAWFQIKEIELGLAADVGTLQRFPKIVGNDSLVRELCYTARPFRAPEAQSLGLVSRVFENKENLIEGALHLASVISSKSPIAVQTTKMALLHARDHAVDDSLHYMAVLNQCMLQSEDIQKAAVALMDKKAVTFSKL